MADTKPARDTRYGEPGTEKWYLRLGRAVAHINRWNEYDGEAEMRVTEIKIQLSGSEWAETMVMVKGIDEEGPIISFTSHVDPSEALRLALERVQNRAADWREDGYPSRQQELGLGGFGRDRRSGDQ